MTTEFQIVFSLLFGMMCLLLSGMISSLSTESKYALGPAHVHGYVKWSNIIVWTISAALGGLVLTYTGEGRPIFMTMIVTVFVGWVAGTFLVQASFAARARRELQLVSDLEQLGDNFVEEFDKDGDGVVGMNDVRFVYQQAQQDSDLRKLASSLMAHFSVLGHDVGGAHVATRADVVRFCTIARARSGPWARR